MIVWAGIGSWLILAFIAMLFLCNVDIFLHYNKTSFDLLNWWLPCLLSSVIAWLLADYTARMDKNPNPETMLGRMFISFGKNHHVYWIPLRYWAFIFLGLGLTHFFVNR
jgi:hypothetical protein